MLRKIIKVGNSRAVIIPQDWLKFYEERRGGVPLEEVLMEINGVIKISVEPNGDVPIIPNPNS